VLGTCTFNTTYPTHTRYARNAIGASLDHPHPGDESVGESDANHHEIQHQQKGPIPLYFSKRPYLGAWVKAGCAFWHKGCLSTLRLASPPRPPSPQLSLARGLVFVVCTCPPGGATSLAGLADLPGLPLSRRPLCGRGLRQGYLCVGRAEVGPLGVLR
jgi:hypothetical protein